MGLLTPPVPVAVEAAWKEEKRKKKTGELEGSEDSLAGIGEIAESNCGWSRSEGTLGTTRKLQILQQIAVSSTADGKKNPAKGSPIYVGITPHPSGRRN